MKAEPISFSELLKIEGVKDKFKRFDIGIGWLDPDGSEEFAKHWLAVVGQQENDEYVIFHEASGILAEIAEAAVDAKDRFLVDRIWLSKSALSSVAYLQDWDGLTQYKYGGYDKRKKRQYLNKPERWPHFRNRETIATLFPVPDIYQADFQSCVDLFGSLLSEKRLGIRKIPQAWGLQNAPLEMMLSHPLMKAICWPLMMMEKERSFTGKGKEKPPAARYGNLRR